MAVRGRPIWVLNAACTVALFVLPAFTHPAPMPTPGEAGTAPVQTGVASRGGALGADMLTMVTQTLRAADNTRRGRAGSQPELHMDAQAFQPAASLPVHRGDLDAFFAGQGHLALIPFCGHGPPLLLGCKL